MFKVVKQYGKGIKQGKASRYAKKKTIQKARIEL